jgi:MAPEG family
LCFICARSDRFFSLQALALSWTAARVVYRVGYVSRVPFGRLVGTSMSLLPMLLAVGYPLYRFVLDL